MRRFLARGPIEDDAPATPAPTLTVVNVANTGGGDVIWQFSGIVTNVVGFNVPELQVQDENAAWHSPDINSVIWTMDEYLEAIYSTLAGDPVAWRILTTPANVTPGIIAPQSGVI